MQAVVLAGGRGVRLRPFTYEMPKPMVSILGKPFLHYQLEMLGKGGISNIVLCVGYLHEQVMNYFMNGSPLGLKIDYSVEERPLGTGGALKLAEENLNEEFFVIYGDSYLPIDYGELASSFKHGTEKAMLVIFDNSEATGVKNNVAIDDTFHITKYRKDGDDGELGYVDAGVLVVKREILDLIPPGKGISLEEEVLPILIERKELSGFISHQRFYDIGTPQRLVGFESYLRERDIP